MLVAFRLMLVYTLFDPLKGSLAYLFIACGQPEKVVRARLVQLGVLAGGLLGFGRFLGIAGVALAVDLMLLTGIVLLFWQAAKLISISLKDLFLAPTIALSLALLIGSSLPVLALAENLRWESLILKSLAFGLSFGVCLLILERQTLKQLLAELSRLKTRGVAMVPPNPPSGPEA